MRKRRSWQLVLIMLAALVIGYLLMARHLAGMG